MYPVFDLLLSLSPAWSESTNILRSTYLPLVSGALVGIASFTHHKNHTNNSSETFTCQELDMSDRIPSGHRDGPSDIQNFETPP